MTTKLPPEVEIFNAFVSQILEPKSDGRPTIYMLGKELSSISSIEDKESIRAIFQHVYNVTRFIDENVIRSKNSRAGTRLKDRINSLFTPAMLSKAYNDYQTIQKENLEAISDLMSFLDHLEYDGEALVEARESISEELDNISKRVASGSDLSDSQQRIVIAQVDLIRRSLARFEVDGVGPFRDSIYCSIGRLTIELKAGNEKQGSAIRSVIDDLIRVKDLAEVAGGTLALTGPFIAGLLTGPALG